MDLTRVPTRNLKDARANNLLRVLQLEASPQRFSLDGAKELRQRRDTERKYRQEIERRADAG